jgi:ferritin-like metal-binding protein YciE
MSKRTDAIQKHLADMLAVEKHILEAIERQRADDDARNDIEANKILIEIERTMKRHVATLEATVEQYGAEGESALKKAVTGILGAAAGLYDQVREHTVSRMLRDDYTALSLAAMSYTALHTFGLAVRENRVADLATDHLKEVTPLLVEISKVLPHVVARELAREEDFGVDATVGDAATANTQHAWDSEVVRRTTA